MNVLNRCLFTVVPRQPLLDWLNRHGEQYTLEELRSDASSYLVDEDADEDEDGSGALKRVYRKMFEHELASWMSDPKAWPAERTFELFQDWFEVTFHSMVIDLGQEEFELEDM